MNPDCNTTTAPRFIPALPIPFGTTSTTDTAGAAPSAITRTLATLELWYHRSSERAKLARLDDEHLADIGVTAEQVEREVGKFFWQA
jgi:uncharacterized protein YjiS (DUF1127 family)